jgi:hypothetical protein
MFAGTNVFLIKLEWVVIGWVSGFLDNLADPKDCGVS